MFIARCRSPSCLKFAQHFFSDSSNRNLSVQFMTWNWYKQPNPQRLSSFFLNIFLQIIFLSVDLSIYRQISFCAGKKKKKWWTIRLWFISVFVFLLFFVVFHHWPIRTMKCWKDTEEFNLTTKVENNDVFLCFWLFQICLWSVIYF